MRRPDIEAHAAKDGVFAATVDMGFGRKGCAKVKVLATQQERTVYGRITHDGVRVRVVEDAAVPWIGEWLREDAEYTVPSRDIDPWTPDNQESLDRGNASLRRAEAVVGRLNAAGFEVELGTRFGDIVIDARHEDVTVDFDAFERMLGFIEAGGAVSA